MWHGSTFNEPRQRRSERVLGESSCHAQFVPCAPHSGFVGFEYAINKLFGIGVLGVKKPSASGSGRHEIGDTTWSRPKVQEWHSEGQNVIGLTRMYDSR